MLICSCYVVCMVWNYKSAMENFCDFWLPSCHTNCCIWREELDEKALSNSFALFFLQALKKVSPADYVYTLMFKISNAYDYITEWEDNVHWHK